MNAITSCLLLRLYTINGEPAAAPLDPDWTSPTLPMPAAAREHYDRGTAAYARGEPEAALTEFHRAYASLGDPVKDGAYRDIVLGSLRGVLIERYEQTGASVHLCRARDLQVLHLEALLLAHGEDSDVEDISGTRRRLRQIRELLARNLAVDPCGPPVNEAVPVAPPVPANDSPPPPRPRSQRATLVGAVGLGLGSTLLGTMAYALIVRRFIYLRIQGLHEANDTSPAAQELVEELRETGTNQRTVALATGITGAALLAGGAVALTLGLRPRRTHPYSIRPHFAAKLVGLTLSGRF